MSRELLDATRGREEANAARDRIAAELEAAQMQRAEIAAERDAAQMQRAEIAAERDAALSLRDEAVAAHEALARTNERLQSELAVLRSAHGAAIVMRRAAQTPSATRRYDHVFRGAIAIAALLAILVIALVLLHVI